LIRSALILIALAACAPQLDARSGELLSVFERSDDVYLRSRPAFVAGKYTRMSGLLIDYYRGEGPIFQHDWELGRLSVTKFPTTLGMVRGHGDPHPENFGIVIASDNTPGLEQNDFDASDRLPALYDVRRLALGIALCAHEAGLDDAAAADIAKQTAASWAAAVRSGDHRRFSDPGAEPVLKDLFKRSARDLASRSELSANTVITDGQRRFLRGSPSPDEPTQAYFDLPPSTRAAVGTLVQGLGDPGYFTVKDAVRETGSGVASWPRIRILVIVEGPTAALEDDVLLEVKELGESSFGGWYGPAIATHDVVSRVLEAAHRSWARPDADVHYFTSEWLGLAVQIRSESDANKGVKVSRLTGDRGTPDAVAGLGRTLGALLARIHGDPTVAPDDDDAFAAEQSDFAARELQQVIDDQQHLRDLLAARGPTLGFVPSPGDAPPNDFAALLGVQP
jgi:uncharacterized protein (DUF2252 family)